MNLRFTGARFFLSLAFSFLMVAAAAFALFMSWTTAPGRSESNRPELGEAGLPAAESPGKARAVEIKPSYPSIATHPLFFPSREPWAPPAPPVPKPISTAPTPLTNYGLIGVIVSGDVRSALIRPSGGNKTITIAEGQQLGGWKLQKITRTSLYFVAGDTQYEMPLQKPSQSRR
jgi:hypothetical protein